MEAAARNMAGFFTLTVDVILYIFRFLRIEDRISFALSCHRFRRLCIEEGVFRKLDLSSCVMSTLQRCAVNSFFQDRQLTKHIRELNISNLRSFNWQMDDHLQKSIKSICPQLQALHILDCRVSLQTLHSILQEVPHLTSLSWSIWDSTSEDIDFLLKAVKSSEGVCLQNIKHLRLHMNYSFPQIQIAKYLVVSCCRDVEEVEIYTWGIDEESCSGGSFPLASDQSIPGLHQPSELQHLNSLVMQLVGGTFSDVYKENTYDFFVSLMSRKSSSTKWKKFCMLPGTDISREQFSRFLCEVHSDDFQSVEAVGVNASESLDELKTLFERIGDNIVRRLHLRLPRNIDWIVEFCNPVSRVGGHSLKFLRLSVDSILAIRAEQNVSIHSFFSNCSKITELDLLYHTFERDICEPLSQLKHLSKLQLLQCAISSKYNKKTRVETSKANLLTFVENCKNITHLDVHGYCDHKDFLCCLTDDDLLVFARLRNLKSLTLHYIRGIIEWTFLKNISEHCRFLTTLRISDWEHFKDRHIPILMESVKFLKHLAIDIDMRILESEVFWNLLSHAKNLERLCIRSYDEESQSIPVVAVKALKSLPRLHVLHLHSDHKIDNADDFYDRMMRMLEEKESDCRFSFEFVTGNRMNTWINHPTGYSLISNKALPLNKAELCDMKPILDIPMI